MNTVVTLGARLDDFRQNYTPTADLDAGGRHWMLDFAPARDYLKIALLDQSPLASVCLFSESGADVAELDRQLDSMIELLKLRDIPGPVGPIAELTVACKLLWLSVRGVFGFRSKRRGLIHE